MFVKKWSQTLGLLFKSVALVVVVSPMIVQAEDSAEAIELRITAIIEKMTVEQKVGQMVQPEIQEITYEDVKKYHIGSILNGGGSFPDEEKSASVDDWLEMADQYYKASTDTSNGGTGIPLIWGTDAVHGHNNVYGATLFPHNIGLGATHNPSLVGDVAKATALEVRASGIDWIFAPTIQALGSSTHWFLRRFVSLPEIDPDRSARALPPNPCRADAAPPY